MRYPENLKPGGTIGFAAPSFGAYIEPYRTCFLRADEVFQAMGYKTIKGPNVFKGDGIGISTDPLSCGRELTEMYASQDNDVLISVGGGELMCETISHLDLEKIGKAQPKWFMGYSDNTNFGFLLPTLFDTVSLYGPCASDFSMVPWHGSLRDYLNILTGDSLLSHGYDFWEKEPLKGTDDPFAAYNCTEPTEVVKHNWDGTPISGRFLGGCLDILVNLCGTRFDQVKAFTEKYKEDGIIWFLEACDLTVYAMRRAFWELMEAGWFDTAKAFIIGRPLLYDQNIGGLDRHTAVTGILDELDVPIILDADLGHLPPMMPFINGGYGTLSPYKDNNIMVIYEKK
ncbi:MAG: LD-carboxypeptidase [Lachnospiraceae bacterium]|nr:LD-carboxypeptidase [Lachnospiraceae bacterium]